MDRRTLIRLLYTASLLISLLALAISGLSCREAAPEPSPLPPAPSPSTPAEPAGTWAPDGTIGGGEYLSEMAYANGDYELFWDSDQQYIYIGMRARTSGWVAVAV